MTTPPGSSIRLANAPCSWGALEWDLGETIGYSQVLDEIRDTGYVGTELGDWGFMPTDPAALQRELQARELELVGAFVPVAFARETAHAEGEERALKTARLMAEAVGSTPFMVLADDNGKDPTRTKLAGHIQPGVGLSQEQWQVYGRGVNRVAEAVRRHTGLRCAFHHHCGGFVETPSEIEALLTATDPELVGLCFDTGHFRFGGGDLLRGFQQFRDRIWHLHFKDCSPSVHEQSKTHDWDYFESLRHGIFCELGKGDVDFAAILAELKNTNYQGWIVVEQDVLPGMGAPKQYALSNREFLRRCGV